MRPPLPHPLLIACALGACTGADQAPSGGDSGADLGPPCSTCLLADEQNYSITSQMSVEVVQLEALSDATVDWSALQTDVQGHPVLPGEIDRVLLVAFAELPPDAVMEGLAQDQLTQSEVAFYLICEPEGATSCSLSDFAILGSTFDVETYFLPSVATWMIVPQTTGQQGGRSFLFLQAAEGVGRTEARITDQTGSLTVEVDLRGQRPLVLAAGDPAITLDWSGLTVDALGNPMQARTLDGLFVARYDATLAELEQRVFDLETDAAELWTMDLGSGTTADLSLMDGPRPFPGVAPGETWLMALRCSTCTHPAPRFMTALRATDGESP